MCVLRKSEQFVVPFEEYNIEESNTPKIWRFAYEWMDSLIYAFLTILIVFTFLFRIVGVSGRSMVPTLQDGDWLAVRAINIQIERGDIVVITQPNSLNEPLIKRVIAVGGDEVNIDFVEGIVRINGEEINEPYIYEPTNRMSNVAFPVTVPEGCVFVMGDNRNDSLDSRSTTVGFIDTRYILGVAQFRFYPFGEWKLDNYA